MDYRIRVSPLWALPFALIAACGTGDVTPDGGGGSDARMTDTRPSSDVAPDGPITPPDVTCGATQTNCGGACIDVMSDPAHCGTCGTTCPSGNTCMAGVCRPPCSAPMTTCGSGAAAMCVDTQTDTMNCGSCGNACASGQTCVMGACAPICAMDQTRCGTGTTSSCHNLMTDPMNCGMCGNACPMGQVCVMGACAIDCMVPPMTRCGSGTAMTCVNTQTDSMNCGSCGNACPTGQVCNAGVCGCPTGQMLCGGACVSTATDTNNCGSCGNVCAVPNATANCAGGACGVASCNAGFGNCNGSAADGCETNLNTNSSSCGSCGNVCTGGRSCSGGTCVCSPGLTFCGASCVNTSTDPSNCGLCGRVCTAGSMCAAGSCTPPPPANDNFASAQIVSLGAAETVVSGNTTGATRDGATVACGCTSSGNVWYRFTLSTASVVYIDTAGSSYDTSVWITDTAGTPVPAQTGNGQSNPGLCNDDSGCGVTGMFSSGLQSRTWGDFAAGTYYVSVSGCGTGAFTLRIQQMPHTIGSFFYPTRFTGDSTTMTFLVGTSAMTSACGGTASGEDVRWFTTCGAQEFFSLCASDGGSWTRASGGRIYDPAMYIRSAYTGGEVVCNDDGGSMGGTNCVGTGGDTLPYGSRLNNVTVPRGLNAVFVDERTGGSGMSYTLRYTVR